MAAQAGSLAHRGFASSNVMTVSSPATDEAPPATHDEAPGFHLNSVYAVETIETSFRTGLRQFKGHLQ